MTVRTPQDILKFWFSGDMEPAWFIKSETVDREIAERFSETHEAARKGELDHWKNEPRPALALTIALDQFPRNLFRGSPRSFESDPLALATARHALEQGFDRQVADKERQFFYLPFMHSESLDDQKRCVEIYKKLGNENSLGFAIKHHDIIERFGRFPHRNAVLGRETTPQEKEFLKDHPGF